MESSGSASQLTYTSERYAYGTKEAPRDSRGLPENIATYQPDGEERQTLIEMSYDVETGNTNLNTPYLELDNRTLQMAFFDFYRSFIGFTQTHASADPESGWQSYLHKPYIMNKSQVMVAHTLANMAYPYFFARDDNNEVAHMEANVIQALGDMVFDESDFTMKMVRAVTSVCYMPYVIVKKYYDGERHKIKLVDMTTFKFANFYESDIQNQRFVIEDELVDFWEMNELYKDHPNWRFVKPGADIYFDANSQLFLYRNDGLALKNMVRRRTWYTKALDREITQINGVLLCDPKQPLRRLGKKKNRPYPFATVVFENFGRETIAGRTLAQKLWPDERLASMLQSAAYDMARQAVVPTVVAYGSQNITAKALAPGAVINAGNDTNFKVEPIIKNSNNLRAAYDMLGYIDRLADTNANSDALRGGTAQKGIPARNAVIAAQNAEISQLGTFIPNLEKFVRDIGLLTMDDIFQHNLAKDIDKVTNKITWKGSLLIKGDSKDEVTLIRLANNDFPTEEEKLLAEARLADEMEKKGYKTIYQINPDEYDRVQYDCEASVQQSMMKNKEIQKALAMEFHQVMSNNPMYNLYEGSKKVTEFYYPDQVDELINKPEANPYPGTPPTPGQAPGAADTMQKQLLNNSLNTIPVPGQ